MNVFANLIEELKDENLLEETVIDVKSQNGKGFSSQNGQAKPLNFLDELRQTAEEILGDEFSDFDFSAAAFSGSSQQHESYCKRAVEEVKCLQMVEHIITGVERTLLKIQPKAFDDLIVKKSLHKFIQTSKEPGNPEFAQAEYELMHEVELWSNALAERDEKISVANIRKFCENSKPALSSAALISLARFYKKSPFNESVRGKFDFVVTKLFTAESEDLQRKLLFERAASISHIKSLYESWDGRSHYTGTEKEAVIQSLVSAFDKFAVEANSASGIKELLENDFFNRVTKEKEKSGELFFEPEILAAVIECNTKTGNAALRLFSKESSPAIKDHIEKKFGSGFDALLSAAVSRTMNYLELVSKGNDLVFEETERKPAASPVQQQTKAPEKRQEKSGKIFGINRWLAIACGISLLLSICVYIWSLSAFDESSSGIEQASTIALPDGPLKQHASFARASSETLYVITQPSWTILSEEEQRQLVTKAFEFAKTRGYKRVNILDKNGRSIGFATETELRVITP